MPRVHHLRLPVFVLIAALTSCSDAGGTLGGDSDNNGGDAPGDASCWEAATLLDLSKAAGAGTDPTTGDAYAKPELSGHCDDNQFVVTSNGMPHYRFVAMTPNALVAADNEWSLPRSPAVADEPTSIPLLGQAGFTVAGTSWFGPNEGDFPDPYGDPIYNGITDECMGHTAFEYHHHALVQKCLVQSGVVYEPWLNEAPATSEPSPVIGWAFDGFPIYGPYGCVDDDCTEVIEFKSSWNRIGDPRTYAWDAHEYVARDGEEYLDQCNGRIGPDGAYGYHATADFPYILGCFAGTPIAGLGDGGGNNGGGNGKGPISCETEDDCEGMCPPGSLGCTCHDSPMAGRICVPTCNTTEDCPDIDMGALICEVNQGICVPEGGPPGGPQ